MSIQDQIYDWVKQFDPWKQDLFLRTSTSPVIAASDVDQVVALLLGERGSAAGPREVTRDDLPGAESGDLPMVIVSLADLRSVNAIADDEEIEFEPGLNIVYGGNGVGKTGYSRILKHAGRTLRPESVLANLAAPGAPGPRATVNVTVGAKPQPVGLDLERPGPALLGRICIADSDAGELYLSGDTVVDYVPASLASVSRLADGLRAVDERLKAMIEEASPAPLDLRIYTVGTAVVALLSNLDPTIPDDRIVKLATLDEAEAAKLTELKKKRGAIEASETPKLRAVAEREAASVEGLKTDLDRIAAHLDGAHIEAIRKARRERDGLSESAEVASAGFADEPLPGVGSDPWRSLWQAAREYAAHVEQALPPDHDPASCPLCMQQLGPEARSRLQRFDDFVRNDINTRLTKSNADLKDLLDLLPDVAAIAARHQGAIERLGTESGEPGEAARAWLERAKQIGRAISDPGATDVEACEPAPDQLGDWIAARHSEAAAYAALEDAEEQKRLQAELAELADRALLAERRQEVLDHLAAMRRIRDLEAARTKLDKTRASRKITELSKDLIEANLQAALTQQLEALEFRGLEVKAKSKSPGGTPKVSLQFKTVDDVPLKAVLSKGEQRRLSLAMFLAEMEVISDPSPAVFDDPVSSIDQEGRRHIARTLLALSEHRQVIVFTHELSFVYELGRLSTSAQPMHVQHLRRDGKTVGHVHPDLPWQGLAFRQRTTVLYGELGVAEELDAGGREAEYEKASTEFCLHLREAFERAVEEGVLNDVVTRRHDTVRISRLSKVAWSEEICDLVDRGTDETSPWAHDRPRADGSSPPTHRSSVRGSRPSRTC